MKIALVIVSVALLLLGYRYFKLRRDYARLTEIETIGSQLRKDTEIKELINNIIVSAKNMLEAEACSLYLVDDNKEELK